MSPPPSAHIGQALSTLAVVRANLPVTISDGRVKTGAQLLERVRALAAGLRVNLGFQSGDRVALAALNSDWYLEWLLAVPCAGGIIAPLNYRWSGHEACEAVQQIEPVLLVIDQHCAGLGTEIKRRFPNLQLVTIGYSVVGAVAAESIFERAQQELDLFWAPNAIALICFTSGTTGKPKGAAISHGALIVQSLAKIAMVNYSSTDVYLHTSPLCHIGGISSAHAMILAGGCHIFLPKFQALDVWEAIKQHQVTSMIAVPAMLKDLTSLILSRDESHEVLKFFSVEMILNGAGSLSLDLLKRTVHCFPAARILSAYGMTEACSSMSFMTLHAPKLDKNGQHCGSNFPREEMNASHLGGFCVGKPAPHVEIIVCGKSCTRGRSSCLQEEGDVLVRGPHMMEKYWGEVGHAFDDSGWFNTGDVGWMDHLGQLWLLGRRKDVIKSGGENVHCYEVEEILSRHPAVAVAAVAGVHDARLGETVGVMLLLKDGWKWEESAVYKGKAGYIECSNSLGKERVVSANSMQLYCRQQGLSRYKIPKLWCQKSGHFVVTATGKVRKDVVREELAAYFQSQSRPQESEVRYSRL